MKILEIILESIEDPAQLGSPAEDLLHLLDNVKMSPEELAEIVKDLKDIVGSQPDEIDNIDDSDGLDAEPTEPVDPTTDEEPVTAEPQTTEPVDTPDEIPDDSIQEKVERIKKPAPKKPAPKKPALTYREQVEQHLSQVTNDEELRELVFSIHIRKFKELAKKIVANKIKSKTKETYRAIEAALPRLSETVEVSLMTDFLNDCLTTGVIDTPAMISGGTGTNRIPLTNDEYEPIIKALLEITLPGGAAVGRGEIGFAFAGIDSVKETTDISVGDLAVEVKASQGTSDFYMKGTAGAGFGNHMSAVKEFVTHLNKARANFKPSNEVKNGGIASLNDKTTKVLQPYFKKMGQEKTHEVLMKVLKKIHANSPDLVEQYSEEIFDCINEDGTVNYEMLLIPTAKLNFDYYKEMSKHDGVLMINVDAFTYFYVEDAESFAELVANGSLKQKGAIEFRTNSLGGLAYFVNPIEVAY